MRRAIGSLVVVSVALAVLLAVVPAMAQPPGGGPPGGRMGMGMGPMRGDDPTMLLMSEKVQEELQLTAGQKEKIQGIRDKMREDLRGGMGPGQRDMSEEERAKARAEREAKAKVYREQIEAVLLPPQTERLEQIFVQVLGAAALSNAKVAAALKITDEQKKQIEQIRQDSRTQMQEAFSGMRDLSPEERRAQGAAMQEKMQKLTKDTDAKIMKVLSEEQSKKLEELKGEKFELDMRSLFPGGPGQGQGRGQRGQRAGGGAGNN